MTKPHIVQGSEMLSRKTDYVDEKSNSSSTDRLPSDWREWFPEILGNSKALQGTLENVSKIANSDSSVLIYGESGTGKELIASAIHRLSNRKKMPFVALNCSAIPEHLLEAELFGYAKGAFTGADKNRDGFFASAEKGTLFLDEIGDMPIALQSKILRVLQEKEYTPLGTNKVFKTDVRVIAATNIDLQDAVIEKKFRADLYYRLNVFPVQIPSLRERFDDLEILVQSFLKEMDRVHRFKEPSTVATRVLGAMRRYSWPGNIRELQNVIERMVVHKGGGEISLEHLPKEILQARNIRDGLLTRPVSEKSLPMEVVEDLKEPDSFQFLSYKSFSLPNYISNLENKIILEALRRTKGNKNQAAKILGMNRTTLVEKIKKRKIAPLNTPSREL